MRGRRAFRGAALAAAVLPALSGCAMVAGIPDMLGAGLHYEHAPWPADRTRLDIPYRAGSDLDKHRLDLFLPVAGEDAFATLVWVHGGGWSAGDRAVGAFGIRPHRNLGRFFAARGYAVVVPSYRLHPDASWQEQIDDVAAAVAWTRDEIAAWDGDPDALFLGGHSAGAMLAAWAGLADAPLASSGASREAVCGLLLVSGAGYALDDEETYALGADRGFFEALFGEEATGWARDASVVHHIGDSPAAALAITAEGEPPQLQRQSDLIHAALEARGAGSQRVTVPGQDHQRILVSMSVASDPVSDAALAFMAGRRCPRRAP